MSTQKIEKLWGLAFQQEPAESIIKFTAGRDVFGIKAADYKLLPYDFWGNKAHCVMLSKQEIIGIKDAQVILQGLAQIEKLSKEGKFSLDPAKEDVHTNIESWLIEKYGIESAGKLHTARSRNDQVVLDLRLYLRDQNLKLVLQNIKLVEGLITQAQKFKDCLVPGFTHHQHAMVTTFGHILLAFATMLARDNQRLLHWFNLHNFNPLGSVVGYGTSFPIDQKFTSQLLGFDRVEINSLDVITNRWEAEADLAFAISVLMNHLSILAETLILFSMPEFKMLKLADQFSTGSSIMPQKKNPDPLEVIKGKAGLAAGLVQGLLSIGKGSFIGYNRDSQWTKYLIFDLLDECLPAPGVMKEVIENLKVNKEQMRKWCQVGFIGATTLLEQLVLNFKIPFRKAKMVMEKAVKYSEGEEKVTSAALKKSLEEEEMAINLAQKQVDQWQEPDEIVKLNKSLGGPGPKLLHKNSNDLLLQIKKQQKWVEGKVTQKKKSIEFLNQQINEIMEA
ncbi:argininosuccinate lyase [candidate division WWE3 bacterium CG_4_9_14_3_um_filter_43_9]|uniref:Argininosuccinate lyase n=3 Tax=Katanobacteria TaxID=422282 RepID=A0A2M7TA71_UNCKA|nr:MAG: argininosuccinate lyase [candidate division WWE3 bacterium CG_4_10_14_0_2_um_filter_42_8]PJA38288.1 MAG: argininosuccinate lyase [candidate division WWE3 bacterium CG_4_9_14_3_um_filter_43_9]